MSTFRSSILTSGVALALASISTQASADVVTVTQAGTSPAYNTWYAANLRNNGTASITTTNAHDGNGSVQMTQTSGNDKADFVLYWNDGVSRTLGSMTSLSFDWYRAPGTGSNQAPDFLAPALRLLVDADGDASTTSDRAYLIWEHVYNDGGQRAVLTDQWNTSNLMSDTFWQRNIGTRTNVENYSTTLAQWTDGAAVNGAVTLNRNSTVIGMEFGIGSGWGSYNANGSLFTGFVDDVSIGFNGRATTFDFSTAAAADVPEPATLALVGLGLGGLAMRRRPKK